MVAESSWARTHTPGIPTGRKWMLCQSRLVIPACLPTLSLFSHSQRTSFFCTNVHCRLLADSGSISFQPLERVLREMLTNDPGKQGSMPLLADFVSRDVPVPAVVPWDATGFGKLKVTTIVLNNPHTSQSAQNLRIFGLGMVDDNKEGTRRLVQDENRDFPNGLLRLRGSVNSLIKNA
eukprot:5624437-Pleurochrysis_carterae.AAC.1